MAVHMSQADKEWADQLHKLVELWREHIANTPGHLPAHDRTGQLVETRYAAYDTNAGTNYIMCCAPGCDWDYEEEAI